MPQSGSAAAAAAAAAAAVAAAAGTQLDIGQVIISLERLAALVLS